MSDGILRFGRLLAGLVLALAAGAAIAAAGPGRADSARQRGDPASRLGSGGDASEYWDLVAAFDSGHRVFARFLMTNEGPGEKTAVAVGHLVHPDGSAVLFKNGRREGRWRLGPDGLLLDIGSSELDHRNAVRRFQVDNDKRGIKIHLRFPAGPTAWPEEAGPGDYEFDLLAAGVPVEGTIWTEGMPDALPVRGRLAAVHTWMDERESDLAVRRLEFYSLSEELALYVSDVTTPGGQRHRWLAAVAPDRVVVATRRFDLELAPRPKGDPLGDGSYPLPSRIELRAPEIVGEITLGREILRFDPLEPLPGAFRFLLSLRSRPQRVWTEATFEFALETPLENQEDEDSSAGTPHTGGGPPASEMDAGSDEATPAPPRSPRTVKGTGVAAVTFLNPLPSPS